ncbi:MAG: ABC transporter ATP-binding protein/permease [Clostridia bacterium]|nr:ABC transporter ATP-binding protein/permease [Clostridia bacterium]
MFKLYKKLSTRDWILLAVLVGLTVLQVYCTMTLVDYIQNIIQSITYLNYHNNPASISEEMRAFIERSGGWVGWDAFLKIVDNHDPLNAFFSAVANATTGDIWYNGGMMLLIAGGTMATQFLIGIIAAFVASGFTANIRSAVYKKVDSFSIAERDRFSTPSLITRTTNDVQQVMMANILMLRMAFAAPVTAIWAIIKIKAASTSLTLATIVAVVILLVFLFGLMFIVMPKFKVMQKLIDKLNGAARENLSGVRVIRAYNAEQFEQGKFETANTAITRAQLFTGRMMSTMSPVMILVMNGVALAIYWLGASLINKGETDYPTIIAFMQLASQIIMAFMMLVMMFVLMPRAQVSAKRINEVLETPLSVHDPDEEKELTEKGTIEFKNVSFGYSESSAPVISDISFKAEQGETVAFIGSTGSGKSTLINLVPRFFDATEGEVLVDGANVKDIKQKTLRSLIGYVPQKGLLFSGTVKSNIALGKDGLSDEQIIKAAKIAEADEFITKMENGYDSEISQGGKNVSGGQKQRLSIARAVAIEPEIFIFDDSFSALDYKTDKKVRENLKELGATKLIVAQRIGTILDADKIIVLDSGKVVGSGTHKELLHSCDVYREIALSQLSKEELGL